MAITVQRLVVIRELELERLREARRAKRCVRLMGVDLELRVTHLEQLSSNLGRSLKPGIDIEWKIYSFRRIWMVCINPLAPFSVPDLLFQKIVPGRGSRGEGTIEAAVDLHRKITFYL